MQRFSIAAQFHRRAAEHRRFAVFYKHCADRTARDRDLRIIVFVQIACIQLCPAEGRTEIEFRGVHRFRALFGEHLVSDRLKFIRICPVIG